MKNISSVNVFGILRDFNILIYCIRCFQCGLRYMSETKHRPCNHFAGHMHSVCHDYLYLPAARHYIFPFSFPQSACPQLHPLKPNTNHRNSVIFHLVILQPDSRKGEYSNFRSIVSFLPFSLSTLTHTLSLTHTLFFPFVLMPFSQGSLLTLPNCPPYVAYLVPGFTFLHYHIICSPTFPPPIPSQPLA